MQGTNSLVHNLHDQVKAFETKLRFWETLLEKGDFTQFQILSQCKGRNKEKYTETLSALRSEFTTRFQIP